jgi:hypothetical protein
MALAATPWSSGHTCRCTFPAPDHSLPMGASAAAAVAIHTNPLCMLTITIQHDQVRDRCRDRQ